MRENQQGLEQQLRQYAGQRIAENMSQETRQDRQDNLYNQPFRGMSDEDIHELRKEVRRLAASLRTRLALRLKRARTGQLDPKTTLRANLQHGSVPLELRHRDHKLKPKIVVICDVSTSMQHVSELMLNMLYAIQDQISKTHAFAFIDHLEYISPYFEGRQPNEAIGKVFERMPGGHYNTDLGFSLENFAQDYMDKLDHRSTLIIVGDARNNYNDPRVEVFRQLARRSRHTIWLNPEAIAMWGTGDSDMLRYAPICSQTYQVSNMAQLTASIDRLLFMH
jgi:uncharacterized protein with von Willebrand factor type A (vWA) domain